MHYIEYCAMSACLAEGYVMQMLLSLAAQSMIRHNLFVTSYLELVRVICS